MCAAKEYIQKNGFTLKAIMSGIVIISFVVSCFMAIAFFIFNAEGADKRSRENKKDIEVIKLDFKEIKVRQENFGTQQTNMYSDVKEIQKDIKRLLRR
jgi:hypothetical protein